MIYDVVVIGNGPAGISSAIYVKRNNLNVLIVSKNESNLLLADKIENYLDSGLYKGKAGAYGIQDGFDLVKEYSGSLNNVIGFPTEKIFKILDKIMKK